MTPKRTTKRRRRRAKPPTESLTLEELKKFFWKQVKKTSTNSTVRARGCWYWQGDYQRNWPSFEMAGQLYSGRRTAYELTHGEPLSEDMRITSLCRQKRCVNPDHLKAVAKTKVKPEPEQKASSVEQPKGTSPLVIAQERRMVSDPTQQSWDVCKDPVRMLQAVTQQAGFGALPGPVRWSTELRHMLTMKVRSVSHIDVLALNNALLVAARLLQGGDVAQTITLLQPIVRRMGVITMGALEATIADAIRSFYPSAPESWA